MCLEATRIRGFLSEDDEEVIDAIRLVLQDETLSDAVGEGKIGAGEASED